MDLLKVAVTSAASVIALFVLTKLMGNKQLCQLSMFDYIIGISIGSIAAEFATELETPLNSLLAMIIYAVIAYLVSIGASKSKRMRKIVNGRPLILFDKGKLYRENFRKARLDISDFLTQCRTQGYFDLAQLQTAVFEFNGSVSFLPKDTDRPLTPSDMNIKPKQQELIVSVILDGRISEPNLLHTGNNEVWLERELHAQGFHSEKEIFLATVNTTDNTAVFYAKDTGSNLRDPFE